MKNRFLKLPIGKKLLVINLLIASLVTMLTTLSLGIYMHQTLLRDSQNNSLLMAMVMAESINPALMFNDARAANEALASLNQVRDVEYSGLYDKSGLLFASYARADSVSKPAPRFSAGVYPQGIKFGQMDFHDVLPILSVSGGHEPIGTMVVRTSLRDGYDRLASQIGMLLLSSLLGFALMSLLLTRLQRYIAQPLIELSATMRNITQGAGYLERAHITNMDEIGELAGVFNKMLDELSKRDDSLHKELKERRSIESKLAIIANIDPVTKLPNRHSYNNQIDKLLLDFKYEQEKFALMFVDLDNFKYVNDTFGHHAGDLLLVAVAERLREILRQEDYIARLGGDEFVVLIRHVSSKLQVSNVAEKMIKALSQVFLVDGHEAFIGASIGITLCPENGEDHEVLQSQADSAMYQAKQAGKNNYQFYQAELSQAHESRVNLEAQLRRSLEHDEIVVYYQPIVEISSARIAGFEALVRWIKQDGAIIGPDAFIPLAEEIGFIDNIGNFVLNVAARQMAEWNKQFGQTFIAINFSSRQFKQKNLAESIFKTLHDSGLEVGNFEMEITESVLMDKAADSKDVLGAMNKHGVSISLDDFGTGYSSLSYLTHFPVNKLKIDKSFVSKLPDDRNAFAVVNAILGLAKSLNLKVVAEGIETVAQQSCLVGMGCTYGQGYLFSKPVPAEKAGKLLGLRSTQAMQG